MGLVQTNVGSYKNMIALPFAKTDVADAAGTLNGVQATTNEYTMPVGGWIVGMGAHLNGTLLTGTLQFAPTVNEATLGRLWSGGNADLWAADAYVTQEAGANPLWSFNAGDSIGLTYSKSGTVTPTTRDMNAILLVLLDNYVY